MVAPGGTAIPGRPISRIETKITLLSPLDTQYLIKKAQYLINE